MVVWFLGWWRMVGLWLWVHHGLGCDVEVRRLSRLVVG